MTHTCYRKKLRAFFMKFHKVISLAASLAITASVSVADTSLFEGLYKPRGEEFAHWNCEAVGEDGGALSVSENRVTLTEESCALANPIASSEQSSVSFDASCAIEGTEYEMQVTLSKTDFGLIFSGDGFAAEWENCSVQDEQDEIAEIYTSPYDGKYTLELGRVWSDLYWMGRDNPYYEQGRVEPLARAFIEIEGNEIELTQVVEFQESGGPVFECFSGRVFDNGVLRFTADVNYLVGKRAPYALTAVIELGDGLAVGGNVDSKPEGFNVEYEAHVSLFKVSEPDRTDREQAERERLAAEQAEQERIAAEQAEQESATQQSEATAQQLDYSTASREELTELYRNVHAHCRGVIESTLGVSSDAACELRNSIALALTDSGFVFDTQEQEWIRRETVDADQLQTERLLEDELVVAREWQLSGEYDGKLATYESGDTSISFSCFPNRNFLSFTFITEERINDTTSPQIAFIFDGERYSWLTSNHGGRTWAGELEDPYETGHGLYTLQLGFGATNFHMGWWSALAELFRKSDYVALSIDGREYGPFPLTGSSRALRNIANLTAC